MKATKRDREYARLRDAGYEMAEHYPAAGRTIMVKAGRVVTITKSGAIKAGSHPPES